MGVGVIVLVGVRVSVSVGNGMAVSVGVGVIVAVAVSIGVALGVAVQAAEIAVWASAVIEACSSALGPQAARDMAKSIRIRVRIFMVESPSLFKME